ncbi:MAG: YdbH domain-containing protein [Alphaproteobacteria bacterium]|nr:YdbH domain-containing protein [Alphaproteobacteria bacterium]
MKKSVLLTGFLAVILTLFVSAYLCLPWIAGKVAKDFLAENGFVDAKLNVKAVGFARAIITDVDLGSGSDVRARSVVVDYALKRVFGGVLDGLSVEDPEIPIALTTSGLDFGPLAVFMGGEGGDGGGVHVRGPITVSNGQLQIATPLGDVVAAIDGDLLLTDDLGSQANINFALQHPKARLSGRMRGILDASDQLQLTLDIQDASSSARIQFAKMAGAINIKGQLPTDLNGGGSLSLSDVVIDGLDLGQVDLSGDIKGQAAEIEFLLGGAGTGLSLQLHAKTDDIVDPQAQLRLSGEMATDGLKGPFALPVNMDMIGAVAFDMTGARSDFQSLPARLQTGAVRTAGPVSGWIEVSHLGVNLPSKDVDATLDGKFEVLVDPRGWRIHPLAKMNLDLGIPVRGNRERLATTFDVIDDEPFLVGGPNRTDPLRIGLGFDGAYSDWFPFSGRVGGIIWPSTVDGMVFEDLAVRFDPWQLRINKLDVATEKVALRLSGPASGPSILVALEAAMSGEPVPGVKIDGGHISTENIIGYDNDGIKLFAQGCSSLRLSALTLKSAQLRPGPIALCPAKNATPVVHAAMDESGLKRIDVAGVLKTVEFDLKGVGEYPLSGMLPQLSGSGSFDVVRGTWWTKLVPSGGDVRIGGPDVAVTSMAGSINIEGREKLLGIKWDSAKAKIVDRQRPLRFTPIDISGKMQHGPDSIDFKGSVGFERGPRANIDARHRMRDNRGHFNVQLPGWDVQAGGAQPQQLVPLLKGDIADVTGSISANAQIDWAGSRTTSSARINLSDLGFGTSPAELAGINGEIIIDDLLALKTKGAQTLRVGLIDAGLPLRDGVLNFTLPGDNSIRLLKAEWPLAGGSLSVQDITIPFDAMPTSFVATIKSLDANEMAKTIDIEDLHAEGELEGSVPVRITDDGPIIDNARIWTVKPGVLRFRSEAAVQSLKQSGEMAELLAQALANFQYSEMDISLDGPLSGDITANARIKGGNPDLYDGKKIELNVNLQGALRDLLQSASVFKDLPDTIRDRVQGPSGKP